MKECIICRKKKSEFSDEHVIPDSIGGYYHIYSVCKTCNSKLGDTIDIKLINHKFIEFQRHLFKLKGKKGNIPNPFAGTHILEDNPEQKVRLEFNDGVFEPVIVPNVQTDENILVNGFKIVVDKRDKDKIQKITDKILERNGIPKENVKTISYVENETRPTILTTFQIDLKEFKIGLLKIAYEFAVETIPAYYNDINALKIAKIIENCDLDSLKDIKFLGSGFETVILKPFAHFFDFENLNKHYLILTSFPDLGLLCFINLFNSFSIGILLSKNNYQINNFLIVGINDIIEKNFEIKSFTEIIDIIYSPLEYRFQYFFPTQDELNRFLSNKETQDFKFYYQNEQIPFFDNKGNIKYKSIDEKLIQEQVIKIYKGDEINEVITQYVIDDEELYIKVLPSNQLCRVVSVQTEKYKRTKI